MLNIMMISTMPGNILSAPRFQSHYVKHYDDLC